ncbi:hypothetical protein GMMP1_140074 [Candidatus Magnetomoraceae bacterium gMMP-1]
MINILKLLTKLQKSKKSIKKKFRNIEHSGPIAGILILLILLIIIVGLSFYAALRDKNEISQLGKWESFITQEKANRTLRVIVKEHDKNRFSYFLEENNDFKVLIADKKQDIIRTHVRRFNQYLNKSKYSEIKNTTIKGKQDNIFELKIGKNREDVYIIIKKLSKYNRVPPSARKFKQLGNIYLKPPSDKNFSLINGYLNLFLEPGSNKRNKVKINTKGHISGGQILLTDQRNKPLATFKIKDKDSIIVKGEAGRHIFLENNPPNQEIIVKNKGIFEIAGLFFEAHIEEALVLSETTENKKTPQRRYPFGNMLHIVGPVSLDSSFQSLGMEYMFQEYLTGYSERGFSQGKIWLTIDHRLQVELIQEIKELAKQSKDQKASALIMNAKTGAILAMAGANVFESYNPADRSRILYILNKNAEYYYNHSCFRRHPIGSVTKPFFAFLGLNLIPDLQNMRISGKGECWTILGHDMYSKISLKDKKKSHFNFLLGSVPTEYINFENYLIYSKNIYQHSLGLLLLADLTDLQSISSDWITNNKNFIDLKANLKPNKFLKINTLGESGRNSLRVSDDNSFAEALKNVFDIETLPGKQIVDDRDISIYSKEFIEFAGEVLIERLPWVENPKQIFKRRSVVCTPEFPRMKLKGITTTMEASNILFGGKGNEWTDVKLCEAFSRIATGLRVEARIIDSFQDTRNKRRIDLEKKAEPLDIVELKLKPETFKEMRNILSEVPTKGTAKQLKTTLKNIQKQIPNFKLIGKTGTINEGKGKSKNSRLFLGCFGLWDNQKEEFTGTPYTFVIYLKSSKDKDAVLNFIKESLPQWLEILKISS